MSTRTASASATFPIIAALDDDGRIVWVNGGWRSFGDRNGLSGGYDAVGENYLAVTANANDDHAERVATGLRRILHGEQESFATVYPCHGPDQERWFQVYVTRTSSTGDASYLVVHRRITDHDPERGGARTAATEQRSTEHRPSEPNADEPSVTGGTRLLTYSVSDDESVIEGLLTAFQALGVDVQSRGTTLQDWIATDAIEKLFGNDVEFDLSFDVWGYPVVVTQEAIRIYASPADG